MSFSEIINSIISNVPLTIIAAILGVDSVRAVIAALGIFDPSTKFGQILYGKRDRAIVKSALRDLGYSVEMTDEIAIKINNIAKSAYMVNASVHAEDAAVQLIIMLSKYILEFNDIILYGGRSLTQSKYYIDTMEISHNEGDKQKLAAIMIYLLYSKIQGKKAPEVIVTPKGGNPLFVQDMAANLNAHLLVAKALTDKSRIRITGNPTYSKEEFFVNYEGSWWLSESEKERSCIIVDCNTSGGSQLLDIVKDIRMLIEKNKNSIKIHAPSDVFVLFRADTDGDNLDTVFTAHQCSIHRFFDLDEEAKAKMYRLKDDRKKKGRNLSYFSDEDVEEAKDIIRYLESKNLFYYHPKGEKKETTSTAGTASEELDGQHQSAAKAVPEESERQHLPAAKKTTGEVNGEQDQSAN